MSDDPGEVRTDEVPGGVRTEEVVWPERRLERHIASGSGWDDDPAERGGGHVPDRNPWRDDKPYSNPAQDGAGSGGIHQGTRRD